MSIGLWVTGQIRETQGPYSLLWKQSQRGTHQSGCLRCWFIWRPYKMQEEIGQTKPYLVCSPTAEIIRLPVLTTVNVSLFLAFCNGCLIDKLFWDTSIAFYLMLCNHPHIRHLWSLIIRSYLDITAIFEARGILDRIHRMRERMATRARRRGIWLTSSKETVTFSSKAKNFFKPELLLLLQLFVVCFSFKGIKDFFKPVHGVMKWATSDYLDELVDQLDLIWKAG